MDFKYLDLIVLAFLLIGFGYFLGRWSVLKVLMEKEQSKINRFIKKVDEMKNQYQNIQTQTATLVNRVRIAKCKTANNDVTKTTNFEYDELGRVVKEATEYKYSDY